MKRQYLLTVFAAAMLAACGGKGSDEDSVRATAAPGVDLGNKVLSIGMLNDESGPVAAIGRPFAVGKRMLVEQVNAGETDILPKGWTVKLVERDHGYNPQRSVQLFNEIRDQVLFLGTSFGTPNTLPLRPLLARNEIVAFPASLSSKMAEFEYTPPLGPSYVLEAMRAMDFAVEKLGKAQVKAGIIYQQDDYGQDGHEGWKQAAAHHGVKILAEETYAPGQADYTAAVAAMKQAGANAVFLAAVPSATGPILGTAAQLDYWPLWIGNSPAWIDRFMDPTVLPPEVLGRFHYASGLPYWGEDIPMMADFLAAYEKYGKDKAKPDNYMLASYAAGMIQLEVAKRMIEAGQISRAGYLHALKTLANYDADGSFPEALDFTQLPYRTGSKTRILKPDPENQTWIVAGDYATPQSGH